MLWVCLHELIPESHEGPSRRSLCPSMGALLGFVLMMCLDQI
jgi:zinc transporter ZupT